jgi:hypothetical protein
MRAAFVLVALALAYAAGTWLGGWLGVVGVTLAAQWLLRDLAPGRLGLGAALAWLGIIAASSEAGSRGRLLERVGGIFGVPGWTLAVLAVGFAFLLAWSTARLVLGLRRK